MFDSAAWMKMFSFWRTLTFLLKQIFFQLIHKVIEDNIIRRCWIERHFFSACCCASLFSDPISLLLRDKNSWLAAVETLRNISLSISFIVFSEKVILWKVKKGFHSQPVMAHTHKYTCGILILLRWFQLQMVSQNGLHYSHCTSQHSFFVLHVLS